MSGKIISGPAAVLLIAFFFFPWIMVSCQGTVIGEVSGYQMATGVPPDSMASVIPAGEMQSEPILFAMPLTGVIALILLGITLWKTDFEQNAAWGQIVLAVATGLIFIMEWVQMGQNSDPMIEITTLPALWGSVIALIAIAAGAIVDLVMWQRARAPVTTAPPPANPPKQSFPVQPDPRAAPPPPPVPDQQFTPDSYGSSQETIVDDAYSAASTGLSQETIVDGDFGGSQGRGKPTVVKTEVLHVQPDASAKLVIEDGNNQGKEFVLYTTATIGRVQDNAIVIDDTAMSSYHARICEENGRFYVQDMDSTNGVYVLKTEQPKWEKQDRCELQDGDKIKLGRTTLLFTT